MKKALLVGVNNYSTQKQLRGCLNDVAEMQELLTNNYTFDLIKTLVNEQVNKDSLASGIGSILEATPGEDSGTRIIYFAGHGGRVFDEVEGDEADKIDENLCMPTYDWGNATTYLRDDELALLLYQAHVASPFLNIYVILDSCHSGTASRDIDTTWDQVEVIASMMFSQSFPNAAGWTVGEPRLSLLAVPRQATESPEVEDRLLQAETLVVSSIGGASAGGSPTTHLLFSGCAASQTCKDLPIDGDYHGIFTYLLTRAVKTNPNLTWSEIHSIVQAQILEDYGQNPQLEGPDYLANRPIFS